MNRKLAEALREHLLKEAYLFMLNENKRKR